MKLRVVLLTQEEFSGLSDDWSVLLDNSNADPLFMSWPWLYSWWETWGPALGLELTLMGVYTPGGQLVGIAPLYRHRVPLGMGLKVTRLHFIGNAWRVSPTVRTEYLGLIADSRYERAVADSVANVLDTMEWDELVMPDSEADDGGLLGKALASMSRVTALVRNESLGVYIDTVGPMDTWLKGLGPNTRRKAFNRRTVFEKELAGYWQHCKQTSCAQYEFLLLLNEFHKKRWGKPCFDNRAQKFHLKLLERLSGNQQSLLSKLIVNGNVVSVLYDIQAGGRVYNLQAGYEESFHHKLSLGTLHLGYAIEQAFQVSAISRYDLLAGAGKNTFYKARFNGQQVNFPTVDLVRSPILRAAYRLGSLLPGKLVSRINRVFRL